LRPSGLRLVRATEKGCCAITRGILAIIAWKHTACLVPATIPSQFVPLDSATASIAAGEIGLIKVDTQGYDFFVLKGMTKTLERNAQVVLVVEISRVLLHKACTSATEFVTRLRELGFDGWELHEHRFFPLLAPEITNT